MVGDDIQRSNLVEEIMQKPEFLWMVKRLARKYPGAEPEDVMQETWIVAHKRRNTLGEMSIAEKSIAMVAKNKARELSRSSRRHGFLYDFDQDRIAARTTDQIEHGVSNVKTNVVAKVLKQLKQKQREIAVACLMRDESYIAFSLRTGQKVETCKSQLRRVKKSLSSREDLRQLLSVK